MKINIVIPVRNGSRRVPNKNFRSFIEDKSLLEIKIEQLLKTFDSTSKWNGSCKPVVVS